jgi:hypothetical protein
MLYGLHTNYEYQDEDVYQIMQRHIPEDNSLYSRHCENLKSHRVLKIPHKLKN